MVDPKSNLAHKSFMRVVTAALIIGCFAGCNKSDPFHFALPNAERIEAKVLLDEFKAGSVACNQYDKATNSCTAAQELLKVTADGIIVSFLTGEPFSYKVTKTTDLKLKNNLLCTNFMQNNATQIGFSTTDDKAKISKSDKRAPLEKQQEVRAAVLDMTTDEETCWAYYKASSPSNGLGYEILMVTYIQGIRQPFKDTARLTFFSEIGQLKLRKS